MIGHRSRSRENDDLPHWRGPAVKKKPPIERLSMTFTADGKRQRLPLIFYSFLVILN